MSNSPFALASAWQFRELMELTDGRGHGKRVPYIEPEIWPRYGARTRLHWRMTPKTKAMTLTSIASQLQRDGVCVVPDFLSPRTMLAAAKDLDQLRAQGEFKPAGTGQGNGHHPAPSIAPDGQPIGENASIRRDETYWWERDQSNPAQERVWKKLEELQTALNRSLFLGITGFEGHYAVYPAGGYYQKHFDVFASSQRVRSTRMRIISVVIYLNRKWQPEDGGQLRIFGRGGHSYQDIDPVGGTMVCFMSRDCEHEVLLSHKPRYSFTGWFTVDQAGLR